MNLKKLEIIEIKRKRFGSYCSDDNDCINGLFCNNGMNCTNPLKFNNSKLCDCNCGQFINDQDICGKKNKPIF